MVVSTKEINGLGAVSFMDRLTNDLSGVKSQTSPIPVKAPEEKDPVLTSKVKPITNDFDGNAKDSEKNSEISLYALFMMSRTDQQIKDLQGASGFEFLESVRDFINSVPEIRDMEITGADGQKTTVGKKFNDMATRYSDNPSSLNRGAVEQEMSGVRGGKLDSQLRFAGGSLIDNALLRYRETSDFGGRGSPTRGASSFHKGIDLAVPANTALHAPGNSEVAFIGRGIRGYGNVVILNNGSGVLTLYAHMNEIPRGLKAGDHLAAGETFGKSGNTGVGTGAHVHFETIVQDPASKRWVNVDPELALANQALLGTPNGRDRLIDMTKAEHGVAESRLTARLATQTVALNMA